jgi:FkbM family methyltransferase
MQADWLLEWRHQGYAPRSLLDIGAHLGGFSRAMLEVFPGCVPTLVEPNPHCHAALAATGWELHRLAASSEDGEAMLHLTSEWLQSTGASLYRENTHFFRDEVLERRAVPRRRIDALFAGRRFDVVKIDTQGAELDVLHGGRAVISQADYILVEVSLVEFNAGGAAAEAVFAALAEMGFRSAQVMEFHRLRGVQEGNLLQMDFLFEREVRRPTQHLRRTDEALEPSFLRWLTASVARCADFAVIDLGREALRLPVHARFGLHAQGPAKLLIEGNPNDRQDWEPLLRHVSRHGRFTFCLCNQGLTDLAYPAMMLEMLPRIAEAGLVSIALGGNAYPWSVEEAGPELVLATRTGGRAARGEGFAHLHWRGGLAFRSINQDYTGVTTDHMIGRLRQSLFTG